MRETRTSGSEGGAERSSVPTSIVWEQPTFSHHPSTQVLATLGMRDDRGPAAELRAVERRFDHRRDAFCGELEEYVATSRKRQDVLPRFEHLDHVVRKEVLGAEVELRSLGTAVTQLREPVDQLLPRSRLPQTTQDVRRCDDRLDPFVRCHAAHVHGGVPRFRTVVDFGKAMVVNVDHAGCGVARRVRRTCDPACAELRRRSRSSRSSSCDTRSRIG